MKQLGFLHCIFYYTFSHRGILVLLVLGSIVGMVFAYYLQKVVGLDPCPLCVFQRIGLIGMGSFAFLSLITQLQKRWAKLTLMILALLSILWSVGVASWHIWLQNLPPSEAPACGPGLNYWIDTLPITQVFKEVFTGSGECALIDWTFLGFSLPQLSLLFFSVLALLVMLNIYILLQKNTKL
ncbi:disulfide bond formation protein [Moraxella macacae 0408225]|uniref:Disulfide bond formation protein B n=1 Tax=Moraxella macacae 0408225 TaxID=1230338 RepID=L2F7T7_9GAMM|nr:disulfide bond formation protein B [Moraxella macacae]ELA09082.1 disulfide bond formation protein [Moraxella macacae 0408225]